MVAAPIIVAACQEGIQTWTLPELEFFKFDSSLKENYE